MISMINYYYKCSPKRVTFHLWSSRRARESVPTQCVSLRKRLFKKKTGLKIEFEQGSVFEINLSGKIQNVFQIPEGLLFQVSNEQIINFDSLKEIVLKENNFQPSGQGFSYFSLQQHPLNNFRPLSLDRQKVLFDQDIEILFTDMNLPLGVAYNHHENTHFFFILEANFEEIYEAQEKTDFTNVIEAVMMQQEEFREMVFQVKSFLNLREIYKDNEVGVKAAKILITECTSNLNHPFKKKYYLNMLVENGKNGFGLKIFQISVEISKDENQQLHFSVQVEKLNAFQNIDEIWGIQYLQQNESYFQVQDIFEKDYDFDYFKQNGEFSQIDLQNLNDNVLQGLLFDEVNRKNLKKFMKSKYQHDSLVVKKNDGSLHLVIQDIFLFQIEMKVELFQAISVKEVFLNYRIKETRGTIICFESGGGKEVQIQIPQFTSELFKMLFQMARKVYDEKCFWNIFGNLFKQNKKVRGDHLFQSDFSFAYENEEELIILFFSCLNIYSEMKNQKKDNILEIFGLNKNFSKKPNEQSMDVIPVFDENQDMFEELIRSQVENDDFCDLIESLNMCDSYKNREFQSRKEQELFPEINFNIRDFQQSNVAFFEHLHILNEDLRIVKSSCQKHKDLSFFLLCNNFFINSPVQHLLCEYYCKLVPENLIKFQKFSSLRKITSTCEEHHFFFQPQPWPRPEESLGNGEQSKGVFDILKFVQEVLKTSGEGLQSLKIINYTFKNQFRLFNLLGFFYAQPPVNRYFKEIQQKDDSGHKSFFFLLSQSFFSIKQSNEFVYHIKQKYFENQKIKEMLKKDKKKQLKNNEFFKFLLNKRIDMKYIESLITCVEYIYKNTLRLSGSQYREFLQNHYLPQKAYELADRKDLFLNKQISPQFILSKEDRNSQYLSAMLVQSVSYMQKEDSLIPKKSFVNNSFVQKTPQSKFTLEDSQEKFLPSQLNSLFNFQQNKNLHHTMEDSQFKDVYKLFDARSFIWLSSSEAEKVLNNNSLSDEKIKLLLQKLLFSKLQQRLSSSVGRGAVSFNTKEVSQTQSFQIPEFIYQGKTREQMVLIKYQFNKENSNDESVLNWPRFHNGVAAGLSISREEVKAIDNESLKSWIDSQGEGSNKYEKAGLLLGLGLQGHLKCFTTTDIFFHLQEKNDAKIIATLLGLASQNLFQEKVQLDDKIIRAFYIHLEYKFQPDVNMNYSRDIQAAAILSLGIYFCGRTQKSLSEQILNQIAVQPFNENNKGRESYSLAAGFALGILNLGRGQQLPRIGSVDLDEKLFNYIEGGELSSDQLQQQNNFHSCNLKTIRKVDSKLCTRPALIALALIHLKENNKIITDRLGLPNSIYEINKCDPFEVLLRVICRNLINWDSMKPSHEFLQEQIPEIVWFLQKSPLNEIEEKFFMNTNLDSLDYLNLSLVYHFIVAGTILSLCLKYPGTGNQQLKNFIIAHMKILFKTKVLDSSFITDHTAKEKLDQRSIFMCISLFSLSLGILMAGKCDGTSFRILKQARSFIRKNRKVKGLYGFMMASQMAIGFLFLGNGGQTFGNKDFQVAFLLLAIYPAFPMSPDDNSMHLQAFRHLFVLAAEENLFHLVDIDEKCAKKVEVQLEYLTPVGKKVVERLFTPLYYSTTDIWLKLTVISQQYYSMKFTFSYKEQRPKFLFIKKRNDFKINQKQLETILLKQNFVSIQNPCFDRFLQHQYLKKLFAIIKENTKHLEEKELQDVYQYYLSMIFIVVQKNMTSFFEIILEFMVNKYDFHRNNNELIMSEQFIGNSQVILDFNEVLMHRKIQKLTTLEQFGGCWKIQNEISIFKKKLKQFNRQSFPLDQETKSLYQKLSFKQWMLKVMKGDDKSAQKAKQLVEYLSFYGFYDQEILREIDQKIVQTDLKNQQFLIRTALDGDFKTNDYQIASFFGI